MPEITTLPISRPSTLWTRLQLVSAPTFLPGDHGLHRIENYNRGYLFRFRQMEVWTWTAWSFLTGRRSKPPPSGRRSGMNTPIEGNSGSWTADENVQWCHLEYDEEGQS